MKLESKAVHFADRKRGHGCVPSTTPIYTATTYVYDSMDELDRVFGGEEEGQSYGRYDNPTRNALADLVNELEDFLIRAQGLFHLLERGHVCESGNTATHAAVRVAQGHGVAVKVPHPPIVKDHFHFGPVHLLPFRRPLERQVPGGHRLVAPILPEAPFRRVTVGRCRRDFF